MSESTVNQRNRHGEWRPSEPIVSAPLSAWPPEPVKTFKWLFSSPGYIWPEHIFWLSISVVTWMFLTPELASMKSFELWWIAILFARNLVFVALLFGGMHYFLYIRKSQGDRLRYTTKPFPTDSKRFKFNHQVRDNMFHTLISGVPVITAYEAITYWLFANNYIGFIDLANPFAFWAWFVLLALLAPIVHAIHFYFGHRLLHVKFLYRHFHSLHHNNVQVGLVQWLIALHPVNALYQIHLAAFLPAPGHCGFEKMNVCKGVDFASGSHFHYQHHKHFECNYGGSLIPLDKWFGTFHDGTEAASLRLRDKLRARRQAVAATN